MKRLRLSIALSIFSAITAVSALGAAETVKPVRLVDQAGHLTIIDRSDRYTLITFYRGDW